MGNELTNEKIMQLGFGFFASKVLLTAIELEVFTLLAKRPLPGPELASRLGLHERGARDFFDTLVSVGMLKRDNGVYDNTPETAHYLDKAKPTYVGGILEMANARLYPFWGKLTEGLKTGMPQNEARSGGQNLFEILYSDPARLAQFLGSMTGLSMGAAKAMAGLFPWANHKTIADVGCAQGGLIAQVALAHPHLTGFGFDLPVVKPHFENYMASFDLQNRIKFHPGDFMKEPLPAADVIVMGHILHDWDLPQKKMLLKKAYAALPKGGAVILYEAIIDDDRSKNTFGLLMSLNMLIETPGGFDYSAKDAFGWMAEAGFSNLQVKHLCGPDSMVIGFK
jgi:SAM-dependent methyltransferase